MRIIARLARSFSVLSTIVFILAVPGWSASSVLSWTGGSFVPSVNQQTVGWNFDVNTSLTVTSLQWYDPTGTNTVQHPVAVWDMSGTLIGTACVGSGCTGSTWSAGYWSTPTTFSLAAGVYDIGGWLNIEDPFVLSGASVTTDPRITFVQPVFWPGPTLQFPGTRTCCSAIGFFGPNFTANSVAPEPGTFGILASGLLALVATARRRLFL